MNPKIRMICEGNLDCMNPVYLTKAEIYFLNQESKMILCEDCKPKYEDEVRTNPLNMELIE